MLDIHQHLDDIESSYGVVFEPSVRTAVEARVWLTTLGLPFTLDALVRAVLRNGFASGSIFAAFHLSLSKPCKRARFLPHSKKSVSLSDLIPDEVFQCLDLAARIRRGLSVACKRPIVTRDSVLMAVARISSDAAIRNLVPRDMAERSISAVRAVAARALSENVGPSRHYLLRGTKDVEQYLQSRDYLCGWYLTRLSVNPSSIDRNMFVHLSLRSKSFPSSAPYVEDWDIPGRHNELYLYGVSRVTPLLPQARDFPELRIIQAEQSGDEGKLKRLALTTSSSLDANPAPTIALEYARELTVAEHSVNGDEVEEMADTAVGSGSSA